MANTNDDLILTLKAQVDEKKRNMGKVVRFSPTTNCLLDIDGKRYNLHTLQKPELIHLLVYLTSLKVTASAINVIDQYIINGHNIQVWIDDVTNKLRSVNNSADILTLKKLETRLASLLSTDKKIELELYSISESLKSI